MHRARCIAVMLAAHAASALAQPGCQGAQASDALWSLVDAEPAPVGSGFALAQRLCVTLQARPAAPASLAQAATPVAVNVPAMADAAPASSAAARTRAPTQARTPPHSAPGASGRVDAAAQARIRALVPLMADVARRHDIDPLLLHALAHVESRHQSQAVSHAGARGLMQVMPATGRSMGIADADRALLSPAANLEASARYLKTLQARFGNNLRLVLAAYNAGEGAVERHGRQVPPYAETRAYVHNVLAVYAQLRQQFSGEAA